ncbi:MAG TPA: hypothetical protein VK928_00775 [Longimicrobiales bacterium]|nr:hypothetical protein [Longimicrobiales bacterium]
MRHADRYGPLVTAAAATLVALIDGGGAAGILPRAWSVASYILLALAIVLSLVAALVTMLAAPRGRKARGIGMIMVLNAVLLATWLLRAHPEIPPDPPLVFTEAAAALFMLLSAWRRRAPGT